METITKNILTIVLAFGLFFLNIAKFPSGVCDAAPRRGQAIVKDYSFRFDGKHTFITLDISKPVKHDIQSAGRNVIAIILKDSTLGEIDHTADVDSDTLKNILFSETTTGDVKIILSLKNYSGVNVRKAAKSVVKRRADEAQETGQALSPRLAAYGEAVFHFFIDIYPAKVGGTKPPSDTSKSSPPPTRRGSSAQTPKAAPKKSKLPNASQTKANLIFTTSDEKVTPAPEENAVETQTPNLKLAALHKSIDELEGQEAKNANADSLSENTPRIPTPKLIGDINPLWYLQFFIDIILVSCIIILSRKYAQLNGKKKEFKTVLAETQNSSSYDDNSSPELSASPVRQPVSEIPSFNRNVQTPHYLDIEVGDDGPPPSKVAREEENASGQTFQITAQPQKSPRDLANEKKPVNRPAGVARKRIRSEQDNSRANKPPEKEKTLRPQTKAELSKTELQTALANISSQIEGLMSDKKDEQKQPPPKNNATSTREAIKRLAKDGVDVNSISKKLGVPSGGVELILNLSDDK